MAFPRGSAATRVAKVSVTKSARIRDADVPGVHRQLVGKKKAPVACGLSPGLCPWKVLHIRGCRV